MKGMMMTECAVVATGGKQYRVKKGDVILVESLAAEEGASHVFSEVLLLEKDGGIVAGAPFVANTTVRATVLAQIRAPKIRVFKMRRRKKSRRTHGHRQYLSRVRIDNIEHAA